MRLHPVATAGSFRVIGEDMETQDGDHHYLLPKGSIIFLPLLILIMRNPRVFDNPDQFQPARWETSTQEMKDSLLPFSLGKKNCVGQALAMVEVHSVVARICSAFDLSVSEEGSITEFFLTMKPVGAKLTGNKSRKVRLELCGRRSSPLIRAYNLRQTSSSG